MTKMDVGYRKNEWCTMHINDIGKRIYTYFDLFTEANDFLITLKNNGVCVVGMTTTNFKNAIIEGGVHND